MDENKTNKNKQPDEESPLMSLDKTILSNVDVNVSFTTGEYVLVNYEGTHFPGQIKAIKNNEYKVSVLHSTINNTWKWPTPADQIWYYPDKILKKIATPILHDVEGTFVINM